MSKISRQDALKTLVLPALAAMVAGTTAVAEAKAAKSAVHYQTKPKNGADCDGCKFFKPGKTKKAMGSCSVVAGPISPEGWCIAYQKK